MVRTVFRSASVLVGATLLAAGLAVTNVTGGAGRASAEPCGNGGNSSMGSSGIGSLGAGQPPLGPQRPLLPYVGANTNTVSWLTGPLSANRTFTRFAISGTDLGISWDNGSGQTLMAFGDTFGDCSVSGQQWRHNVLLRTNDTNMADGISVPDALADRSDSGSSVSGDAPTVARQLIPALGLNTVEVTAIPTAAIALPRPGGGYRQYINYMSVRLWGSTGNWLTNFSAIAHSDDNGQHWVTDMNTILVNAPVSLRLPGDIPAVEPNNGKFQQSAYVRGHGADGDYVYQFGTPNGRFGAGFLARFHPQDILDLGKYQYWAGTGRGWVNSIAAVPDDGSAIVVRAPVTELSVAWSPYLNKYLMLDGDNGIRMRTADHPEGPWSAPTYLVPPGALVLYGPMLQPHSPALQGSGKDLYFNASRWSDYNVMLLHTDLSKLPH